MTSKKIRDKRRLADERLRKRLEKFGMLDAAKPSARFAVPWHLSSDYLGELQRAHRLAVRFFERRLERGARVFHVTLIVPIGLHPAGALCADIFRNVRKWGARRARNLARHGRYAVLGVVDVSWNEDREQQENSHWCVHLHLLVWVKAPANYVVERLLADAFRAPRNVARRVFRPVVVQKLANVPDVRNVGAYAQRRFGFNDLARRVSGYDQNGMRVTRDRPLPKAREQEVLSVLIGMPPKQRIIISGFRWQGSALKRRHHSVPLKRDRRYWRGLFH